MANFAKLRLLGLLACITATGPTLAADVGESKHSAQVARGKYLVTLGGCTDCHTPGTFTKSKPDMDKFLAGSDFAFNLGPAGLVAPRNITPDKETGLGNWTDDQIFKALTTGVRPDGRTLSVMPWPAYHELTKSDAMTIVAYLRTIKPVHNEIPGPYGPNDKVSVFVSTMVPADVYNANLKKD